MNNLTEYITVESSMIKNIWYKHSLKLLCIEYNSGGNYNYENVPKHVFEGLRSAESKGSFMHHHIISKFEFSKN